MSIILRPYQDEAAESVIDCIRRGLRRVLLVAPTGSGKTCISARFVSGSHAKGKRGAFLAHRRELIAQSYRKFLEVGLTHEHLGVIMGDKGRITIDGVPRNCVNPAATVQVCSVDTLRNRKRPPCDWVIVDECHRVIAKSYGTILADWPDAVILGLTATPYRLDRRGMREVYQAIVVVSTPSKLMAEGYLVRPEVWSHPGVPDLTQLRVDAKTHDYRPGDLDELYQKSAIVGDIVEHWKARAQGRRTVAFASGVAASQALTQKFIAAGVRAEHLDGKTPEALRDAILGRLERGETEVVSNVGVLCEGWDQPSVKCAILARPTESLGLYLQQAGRILRPWEGVGALILDHAGNAAKHGLPQDDRTFSLNGEVKSPPGPKTCPECYALIDRFLKVCPHCGHSFNVEEDEERERKAREGPEQVDGHLVRVEEGIVRESRKVWYRAKLAEAAERGRKLGWARHAYRERFGAWPSYYAVEREFFPRAPAEQPPEEDYGEPWEPPPGGPGTAPRVTIPAEAEWRRVRL